MTLLIVEDEARIAAFLARGLEARGYAVEHVVTGAEAFERVRGHEVDLMILDLGLPDVDGFELLRQLREEGEEFPVIILTARGEVPQRVEGLNLGADDYLTKPFAFDELLARIRARLRDRDRRERTVLEAGNIRLDLYTRQAEVGGRTVDLSTREFTLIEIFLRHPGEVLTRRQLLASVWGFEFDPGTNVVDVYIGYLRKKLGESCIETVRGTGYRLTS
jgi:DNA-binding response OmpR family regulator